MTLLSVIDLRCCRARIVALTIMMILILQTAGSPSYRKVSGAVNSQEAQLLSLIEMAANNSYNYDLELERMALNSTLSQYSYRSGGSFGADTASLWLMDKFRSFGLEAGNESFQFTTWDLPAQALFLIDNDSNPLTTSDQTVLTSFLPAHLSWPTSLDGVFASLVVLPYQSGSYPAGYWDSINTTGRVVLFPAEIRSQADWRQAFLSKIASEHPIAVVKAWWFQHTNPYPIFGSSEGKRTSWSINAPMGVLSHGDGLFTRNLLNQVNASAKIVVPAVISEGPHYNVVGRLRGADSSRHLIISSHYDTVMTPGFWDNGAGTAGVVELGRIFAEAKRLGIFIPDYDLVFLPFTSEEFGLLGSIYYVDRHKAELQEVTGVMELDAIGLRDLHAEIDPNGNLHLFASNASSDLGTPLTLNAFGIDSDHASFADPAGTYNLISSLFWSNIPNISDAPPRPATLFFAEPYQDYIHTPYDNSSTPNWVQPSYMKDQLKLIALTITRWVGGSSSPIDSPSLSPLGIALALLIPILATLVLHKKRRTLVEWRNLLLVR